MTEPVLRIAVPCPLRRSFDYLPPEGCEPSELMAGIRVRVPFGTRSLVGVLLEVGDRPASDSKRLKRVQELLDQTPLLPAGEMSLLRWASAYYQHPIGEVVQAALPGLLRRGAVPEVGTESRWRLTETGRALQPDTLVRAPRQRSILESLASLPNGARAQDLKAAGGDWRRALRVVQERGWAERFQTQIQEDKGPGAAGPGLNPDQQAAVDRVRSEGHGFAAWLLHGVTGSGKTEVYLHLIETAIAQGLQSLVLVPEISLTPQTVARFRDRLAVSIAVLHSGLSDRERLQAWQRARVGDADVVIGTRSAVFTPLVRPGLVIIDEEHDLSFKQQDGFRYSARDVAVMRAHRAEIPVVLGSATPSLESLQNVQQDRYGYLHLPARAGGAGHPSLEVLDMRGKVVSDGLSRPLLDAVQQQVDRGEQALLFLNRRGYAPVLICRDCGWLAQCTRCDARMTFHRRQQSLRCHHCGHARQVDPVCPDCGGAQLHPLGEGTQRIESALRERFPDVGIGRIDRDTLRGREGLHRLMDEIRSGALQILVGTQILAKGHDFPGLTLVAVLDADQGLFGSDFRAAERMAQLITQVAGRAGRASKPGRVLLQTYHPDHPLLRALLAHGYGHFSRQALQERQQSALPPFTSQALLRAEAPDIMVPQEFLRVARALGEQLGARGIEMWGPVPAPMERRAGRYRAQLLVQALERGRLHAFLDRWVPTLESMPLARKVRWSLDVDPMEMG